MKNVILLCLLLLAVFRCDQPEEIVTSEDLLNKSIAYHDPNNKWETFQGEIKYSLTYADSSKREGDILFDFPNSRFEMNDTKDSIRTYSELDKDQCHATLNGSEEFTQEQAEQYRLTCDAIKRMRNYYAYTFGLPMKLKDPGTNLYEKIDTIAFKGQDYLRLKVTYDQNVGEDTWYFYLNPENYKLEVAQFFHDETKNDGEYILMSDEEVDCNSIKFTKQKDWFTNKDDAFLGADIILVINPI